MCVSLNTYCLFFCVSLGPTRQCDLHSSCAKGVFLMFVHFVLLKQKIQAIYTKVLSDRDIPWTSVSHYLLITNTLSSPRKMGFCYILRRLPCSPFDDVKIAEHLHGRFCRNYNFMRVKGHTPRMSCYPYSYSFPPKIADMWLAENAFFPAADNATQRLLWYPYMIAHVRYFIRYNRRFLLARQL